MLLDPESNDDQLIVTAGKMIVRADILKLFGSIITTDIYSSTEISVSLRSAISRQFMR